MAIDKKRYRSVMGLFATGVTVVATGSPEEGFYGLTVSSFTSVSLTPPLVSICLDNRSSGLSRFRLGSLFSVSILSDEQRSIAEHFATPGTDRSEASGFYATGRTGVPVMQTSIARMECRLQEMLPAGDHTILLGEIIALSDPPSAGSRPLLYFAGVYGSLQEGSD